MVVAFHVQPAGERSLLMLHNRADGHPKPDAETPYHPHVV